MSDIWNKFIETEKSVGMSDEELENESEKRDDNPILYDCALAVYEFDAPYFLKLQLEANSINVNEPTPRSKQQLLYLAIIKNRMQSCKLLIQYGADLNYTINNKNYLWWAKYTNADIEIVNMLLHNSTGLKNQYIK